MRIFSTDAFRNTVRQMIVQLPFAVGFTILYVTSAVFVLRYFTHNGIVAIFWVGRSSLVEPAVGLQPVLIAFIAAVVGGMENLALAGFV